MPVGVLAVTVTLAGQVIAGACVSLTVTVKVHGADVLPAASRAVQVTVVVPIVKNVPLAGEQVVVTAEQLSEAAGVKVTLAPHWPGALPVTMLAGQAIVGAVVSFTVTVNVHDAVFLDASVALHVTVVTPSGNELPEAGEHATVADPPHASVAVGVV